MRAPGEHRRPCSRRPLLDVFAELDFDALRQFLRTLRQALGLGLRERGVALDLRAFGTHAFQPRRFASAYAIRAVSSALGCLAILRVRDACLQGAELGVPKCRFLRRGTDLVFGAPPQSRQLGANPRHALEVGAQPRDLRLESRQLFDARRGLCVSALQLTRCGEQPMLLALIRP